MAKLNYAFLIFVLAIFCLQLFCAHAQRRLAPGPFSEEEEEIQRCLDLTTTAGKQKTRADQRIGTREEALLVTQ